MHFRQWISPMSKTLYDSCVQQNESNKSEFRPDHSYARPWIDDPTIPAALPTVQLFTNPIEDESTIDIDQILPANDKIHWAPTITTQIPERFECLESSTNSLTEEQTQLVETVKPLLDETRLTALCCESNSCNVVYWRLAMHRIAFQLISFLKENPQFVELLVWLHQYICESFDRTSIGNYVDLFQILYEECPKIRSTFVEKEKPWPNEGLCCYVYERVIEKSNDLTEEVIYSLPLASLPTPMICLLIPGLGLENHLRRVEFWQKNLSQITTVLCSIPIDKDQRQVQEAYDDVLKKFHEIRQLYPNHKIMFIAWNVGCILALKAALVCPVSTIISLSLPYVALSQESKNDFVKINASILFIESKSSTSEQINQYRQRLKSRNSLIELEFCDDQLRMSEEGKSRFRLTQQMIDKLLMEEILDFIAILSPKNNRSIDNNDEIDGEAKRKKLERLASAVTNGNEESEDVFLYTGENRNSTSLTIAPEQDPNTIFLNTVLTSSTTTRKRKTTNTEPKSSAPKRGRQKAKNSTVNERPTPAKTTSKKTKQAMIPTATTSILNTLLQLPTNQPKSRPIEANLMKSFN